MPHFPYGFVRHFFRGENLETVKFKLEYEICENNGSAIPAIIVSAGSSQRMNGVNKQLLEIVGVPVIARTLGVFEGCKAVSRIILVARKEDILSMQCIAEKYGISKLTDIVEGGSDRNESVKKGMAMLAPDEKKVLIHDGARPLVCAKMVEQVVNGLENFDAVVPAVKINDTVKLADDDLTVKKTVDRTGLYAAQTPQGVWVDKYIDAQKKLGEASVTDDACVMEAAGYKVKITDGDRKNIKITCMNDVEFALILLKGE